MRVNKENDYTQVQVCKDIRSNFWPLMSYSMGVDNWGNMVGRHNIQDDLIKVLSC